MTTQAEGTQQRLLWRLLVLGPPLALAALLLLHPHVAASENALRSVLPVADRWLFVHLALLPLFALAGASLWVLVDASPGRAVAVSRVTSGLFAVFYTAGDAVAGAATGILARNAVGLPAAEQTDFAGAIETLLRDPVKNTMFTVGILAWILGCIAAAIALRSSGAPLLPRVLLGVSGLFLAAGHTPPFGTLAFGGFFVAALWIESTRRKRS